MGIAIAKAAADAAIFLELGARIAAAGQAMQKAVSDALAAGQPDVSEAQIDGARQKALDARAELVQRLGFDPLTGDSAPPPADQ